MFPASSPMALALTCVLKELLVAVLCFVLEYVWPGCPHVKHFPSFMYCCFSFLVSCLVWNTYWNNIVEHLEVQKVSLVFEELADFAVVCVFVHELT